ncbi:thioredoxin family protein [Paenibacillus illinoisensis]|uniref:thioredoxin family protein n=1 Tax=Paenibacillus illinoisensis TaxID=59845 RepID=UPI00301D94FA
MFKPEDLSIWNEVVKRNLRRVVLTADWCRDAALNMPIVQKIAEHSIIELRFLNREEMDQYLTNETSRAIPIFIFITESGEVSFL